MDKSKWEYKKLGEVCDLYQPKTISSDMLVPDGKYLVYGANGVIGKYNKYNHENSEVLMTCRGATCGTINVSAPYSWINGNAMVVHPRTIDLNAQYLLAITYISYLKNNEKGIYWLDKSANGGNDHAQYLLGAYYNEGSKDFKIDNAKTVYWFSKAAEQGNANAQI